MIKIIPAFIYISYIISGNTLAQTAEYKRFGNYFEVSKVKYWVRGIHNVGEVGTIGYKTGTDSLARNGFQADGHLGNIPEFRASTATISGRNLIRASARFGIDLAAVEGINVTNGSGDSTISRTANYTVFVVSPRNWGVIYQRLQVMYNNGASDLRRRFRDKNFRIIDSVVYASNMRIERTINTAGSLNVDGQQSKVTVSANLQGSVDVTSTFELTGKQIIAYSFRRLCWNNRNIVSSRIDHPIRLENGCSNYK